MKRPPVEHQLKTWPKEFAAVLRGDKRHETRSTADRDFRVGDTLRLQEWVPRVGAYSGREVVRLVSYISRGPSWGLPVGLCVLSIRPLPDAASQRGGLARARGMTPEQRSAAARGAALARWAIHRAREKKMLGNTLQSALS
jgi:hypothetical protein